MYCSGMALSGFRLKVKLSDTGLVCKHLRVKWMHALGNVWIFRVPLPSLQNTRTSLCFETLEFLISIMPQFLQDFSLFSYAFYGFVLNNKACHVLLVLGNERSLRCLPKRVCNFEQSRTCDAIKVTIKESQNGLVSTKSLCTCLALGAKWSHYTESSNLWCLCKGLIYRLREESLGCRKQFIPNTFCWPFSTSTTAKITRKRLNFNFSIWKENAKRPK
jgi:hypothetical protein